MNAIFHWIEESLAAVPLPLFEVWGRLAYFAGWIVMLLAFGGFTLRPGGRWGLGREHQAWDRKAIAVIPLTFLLITITGYLGSFIVLVPGAQTFESLKDLVVFLCIVLFGYPALITVPFAYGLSDLIEGTPPAFILDWLPGYFINPACFWLAYQFFGKNPDFRRVRTWLAYAGFVAIFMAIEPVMWGYICAEKFTPGISFRTITPALFLTTGITWVLAPLAMLGALPLSRKLGIFWADIRGHVKERSWRRREWVWASGSGEHAPDVISPEASMPIRMLILAPFIVLMLLMVGATAYVTLRSAEDEANRLATRLHQEITRNLTLHLDEHVHRPERATPAALTTLLQNLSIAGEGRAFIADEAGQLIAASTAADDPVLLTALGRLHQMQPKLGPLFLEQEFRFVQITSRPLTRETWLARVAGYRAPNSATPHWLIVTAMPESYYLAGVRTGNSRSAMIFVLALLLSIALAAVLASVVTAPLRRISRATRALAQGDLVEQLPDSNLEELRVLTRSFNDMAGRLKQNFDSIHAEMERRQGAELQVHRLNRTYAMLSEINRLLVRKYQPAEVLTLACQIAIDRGGFRLAWIGLINPTTQKLELVAHGGASPDTMAALRLVFSDPALGCDFTAQALNTATAAVCEDIEHDPRSAPWRALALERGYRSLISLPLIEHGRTTGNFNLYAGEPFFFDRDEFELLNELAANLAFAREVAERERRRLLAEERNSRQRDALITLTGQQGPDDGDLAGALRRITESSARTLLVSRVSVWRYTPDRTGIACQSLFDLAAAEHRTIATQLAARDYPAYFQALASGDVLAVDDVCTDSRTGELTRTYFEPLGIGALMDIPIYLGGTVIGVVCHEHVGPPRLWTSDEKTFALAMANRVSLSIEASERKQAVSALRTSEERFRELADTVDDVFWINDPVHNQMLYVSPAYERIWGQSCQSLYQSFRSWIDSVHADDRDRLLQVAQNQQAIADKYEEEFRIIRPDGAHRWIRARAYPVRNAQGQATRIVGIARDITESRLLEDQLHQAQKMEAIGQLAGGVAHDFNNILAAILMQTELLLRHAPLPEKISRGLDMIRQSSERAANLTRQLLLFSRKQVMQPRVLDLNESITRLTSMLDRIIGEDITLQLKLSPEPLLARADEGMIDQVVMNLVVNSRDAMPRGGQLIIETGIKVIDESVARLYTEAKPGCYAWLCVSDSGEGIPPHVIARIFEPFFTTKRPGKGTGLGLATVFGIVKQHQGWIRVYSEVGHGTTFQVFIPSASATTLKEESHAAPAVNSLRGTETILLAEDDDNVRNMTQTILELQGYRILSAPDGAQALAVWHRHRADIALLITDLIMPGGLGGKELAQQVLAENPRLKIIYTSGYSSEMAGKELELRDGENFLQKPSPSEQILRCVRACLDA